MAFEGDTKMADGDLIARVRSHGLTWLMCVGLTVQSLVSMAAIVIRWIEAEEPVVFFGTLPVLTVWLGSFSLSGGFRVERNGNSQLGVISSVSEHVDSSISFYIYPLGRSEEQVQIPGV